MHCKPQHSRVGVEAEADRRHDHAIVRTAHRGHAVVHTDCHPLRAQALAEANQLADRSVDRKPAVSNRARRERGAAMRDLPEPSDEPLRVDPRHRHRASGIADIRAPLRAPFDQVEDRVRLVDQFHHGRRDDSCERVKHGAQRRERTIEVDVQKVGVLERVAPAREVEEVGVDRHGTGEMGAYLGIVDASWLTRDMLEEW